MIYEILDIQAKQASVQKNPHKEVWRWQNQMFEKQIVSTINNAREEFQTLKKDYEEEFSRFNFQII